METLGTMTRSEVCIPRMRSAPGTVWARASVRLSANGERNYETSIQSKRTSTIFVGFPRRTYRVKAKIFLSSGVINLKDNMALSSGMGGVGAGVGKFPDAETAMLEGFCLPGWF